MGSAVAGVTGQDRKPQLDFALIGHQESWRAASDVLAVLRGAGRARLPDDEIREIFPWIPPRAVCRVEIASATGATARGLYIDSFIPPDCLGPDSVHDNIGRVRAAAACAINAGAKIVSLGGFSSILIEGNFDLLPERHDTVFTTGNTLTVGFIVQGIRKMCATGGPGSSPIDAPDRWSNRRCWFRLCPLPGAFRQTRHALRTQCAAAAHPCR